MSRTRRHVPTSVPTTRKRKAYDTAKREAVQAIRDIPTIIVRKDK